MLEPESVFLIILLQIGSVAQRVGGMRLVFCLSRDKVLIKEIFRLFGGWEGEIGLLFCFRCDLVISISQPLIVSNGNVKLLLLR